MCCFAKGDGRNWTTCDPWTAKSFSSEMEEFTDCPQCRSDCELTTYSTSITATQFRWLGCFITITISFSKFFIRACDSRNLNLSPFCTLTASSLLKWQPAINSTYGNITTNYTSGLSGPARLVYPTMKQQKNELLSSLTKVTFLVIINCSKYELDKVNSAKL